MGHQIIKQPDGLLAVWSTVTDSWMLYDATPAELLDYYAERAAKRAREDTQEALDAVIAGDARRVYFQFALTFDQANTEHLERGHEPVPFGFMQGPV